ncbi:MAG: hypothetical protein ACRDUA_00985 [Micromonosporaceae bacterium]
MEDAGALVPDQRSVVPYGGDTAVARSIVAVHVRNPWTGRCRGCRDAYPCRSRQDADEVLRLSRKPTPPPVVAVSLLLTALPGIAVVVECLVR